MPKSAFGKLAMLESKDEDTLSAPESEKSEKATEPLNGTGKIPRSVRRHRAREAASSQRAPQEDSAPEVLVPQDDVKDSEISAPVLESGARPCVPTDEAVPPKLPLEEGYDAAHQWEVLKSAVLSEYIPEDVRNMPRCSMGCDCRARSRRGRALAGEEMTKAEAKKAKGLIRDCRA